MTDVFACDVLIPEVYEASSFGLRSQCLQVPSTIWLMCTTDHITDRHEPDAQLSQIYSNLFHLYERIYKRGRRICSFGRLSISDGGIK